MQKTTTINTGTYVGYTLDPQDSSAVPTLYFTNGHFTQKHKDPQNVGWHPNESNYRAANVDGKYSNDFNDYSPLQKGNFIQSFRAGKLDVPPTGNAVLFEVDDKWTHFSRSYLLKPGDNGFNASFNAGYATNAAKTMQLAPNEQNQK